MRRLAATLLRPSLAGALALAAALAFAPARGDEPPAASSSPPNATPFFAAEAVRAAYLVNFIRFTEWPAPLDKGPLIIGVSGSRALEDELIRLADRQSVAGKPLRILRIKNLRDLAGCHVVYFARAEGPGEEPPPPVAACLEILRDQPVLTVSEAPDFLALGGIINLYREDDKLRFEIAPGTARQSRLELSSRLLKLARIVREPAARSAP